MSSAFLLEEELPGHFLLGFTILVAGMLLISHFKFTTRSLLFLSGSGIFFGFSTVVTKLLLQNETFINGFFWSRMANVVVALAFLLVPSVFVAVRDDFLESRRKKHHVHPKTGHRMNKIVLIVGNKILAAMGFICVLIALKSGNATMVNALSATQYIFLLIFAIFFGRLMPEYFEETVHKHEFLHKTLATGLIVIGFIILFL
jgi:drug/metabolite transporter (DMT)-like permease